VTSLLRAGVAALLMTIGLLVLTPRGEAHKPITSPFTFNEDIFPLVRDRCGRCHVSGGVAPMSLMTHADAVPWGESIRAELLAGTMPPWSVDTSPGKFRNVEGLTAREMNVLLTWVTGGTPIGGDKNPAPIALDTAWHLGPPDLELQMPAPFALNADTRETTTEFTLPTGTRERRLLRAVDLRPGTPSIVRAATISVKSATATRDLSTGALANVDLSAVARSAKVDGIERLLALWLPGDDPVPLDQGLGYELPAGAELVVRVLYRKTWEFERKEMSDRSTVALYFAENNSRPVEQISFETMLPNLPGGTRGGVAFGRPLDRDVRALAIYPESSVAGMRVKVDARRPDGSRVDLIAFHPRPDWSRRYWFVEPIALPRGTNIGVSATVEDESPLLPLSVAPGAKRSESSRVRVTLNVIP
jgi:hypothetical protein